jgi:hypothetical protein
LKVIEVAISVINLEFLRMRDLGKKASIEVPIKFNLTNTICRDEEGLYQFHIPDDLKCLTITIMMEHRRETMRQTEKTSLNMQSRNKQLY